MALSMFSFVLYVLTLAPTVIWGDSAKFVLEVKEMRLGYRADDHPLFIILGKLFSVLPFDPAYDLNLLSAVSASITVFLVYLIIVEITNSKISALIGSLALCVSHAFWLHAVVAEVYDLNAAFLAAIIFLLLKWRKCTENYVFLYIAVFLSGLGVTNHRVLLFDLMGMAIFVLVTESKIIKKWKVVLSVLTSFFMGSLLLVYILVRDMFLNPVMQVADKFSAEGYKSAVVKYSPEILQELGLYLSYLFYQFPLLGYVLGFTGFIAIFRKDRKLTLFFSLLIGVNALFFIKFGPSFGTSKFTFYISAYMVFSLLIGCGYYTLHETMSRRAYPVKLISVLNVLLIFTLPVLSYSAAPYLAKKFNIDLLHARKIANRDNDQFFLNPSKRGYNGAEKYALDVFNSAKPDSIIIADHTPYTVLRYFREVKGLRKDLLILTPGSRRRTPNGTVRLNSIRDIVHEYYGEKNIYLADMQDESYYKLNPIRNDYDFILEGVIYRVVRRQAG